MIIPFHYRKIEEKRGVTVTDSGIPEVKSSLLSNGLQSQALDKTSATVASATRSNPSWDEDWGPITKGSTNSFQSSISNSSSTRTVSSNQPIQSVPVQLQPSIVAAISSPQAAESCPAVDVEWPPRATSVMNSESREGEKQQLNAGLSSSSSFDEIDPFADWPPRRSGASSGSGTPSNGNMGAMTNNFSSGLVTNTPNSMNFQTNGSNSWASNNHTSALNTSSLNSGGLNNLNSIGFMKQTQSVNSDKKSNDLGSIFSSSKTEQTAPKLAPPPSNVVGRGRGRGRGVITTSRPSHVKPSSEQPPLLDLL